MFSPRPSYILSIYLDSCGGDVSKSGGKLSIQVGFKNEGVGQHNFLDSPRDLVITQGVTRTKLGNLIKIRLKLKAKETLQ